MKWSETEPRSIKQKLIIFFSAWAIMTVGVIIDQLMGLPRRSSISLGPLPFEQLPGELIGIIKYGFFFGIFVVWFDSIGRKKNVEISEKKQKKLKMTLDKKNQIKTVANKLYI